jgi:hypothetical protein
VIAERAGTREMPQRYVEIAERVQEPAQDYMRRAAQETAGHPQLGILQQEDEQCRGGTGSLSFRNDFESPGQLTKPIRSVTAIVGGIGVIRVTERHDDVGIPAGREYAFHFADDLRGIRGVFEHRVAFDTSKKIVGEGKAFRIGGNIDAMQRE